jgi:hypothetical protein
MTTHMKVNAKCVRFAPLMFSPSEQDMRILFTFKILTDMKFIAEAFGKKSTQTFQGANLIFSPT